MIADLRSVALHRIGLSDLTRTCDGDPLIETPQTVISSKRYCFVTTKLRPDGTPFQLQTDEVCCQAQARFVQSLKTLHAQPGGASQTGLVHKATLPFKMFFLLMLLVMSIVLLVRHRELAGRYGEKVEQIEKGIVIGALAMLFFPGMNHAFLQAASLLYGASHASAYRFTAPFYSLGFGGWALLLLLFFYRRRERDMQEFGRIAGVIASAIAIVKYDLIIDYAVRIAGVGADAVTLAVLAALAVLAIGLLYLKNVSDFAGTAALVAIASAGVVRAKASAQSGGAEGSSNE